MLYANHLDVTKSNLFTTFLSSASRAFPEMTGHSTRSHLPAGGTDGGLAFIEHSTTFCLFSIFLSKILEKDGNLGKPNQNCVSAIP